MAQAPPAAPRKTRRVFVIIIAIAIAVIAVLVLLFVPLESTASAQTIATKTCSSLSQCPTMASEFTVGDSRYAIVSGTWVTNISGADIVVTVNNGASSQACGLCSGQLYSSVGSTTSSGSFDVSGFGPFHISVNQIGSDVATTTVQVIVNSAVI